MASEALSELGIYAIYDLAIDSFIRSVFVPVQGDILVVQSSPQRAFASAAAMIAKGTDNPNVATNLLNKNLNSFANVPLPLVSFTNGGVSPRDNQRIVPLKNLFRKALPLTDSSARERWIAAPPIPVWLTYNIDVWCKTRNMLNQLVTAMINRFKYSGMAYGNVEVDDFWGNYLMALHMRDSSDNSELEGGQDKDRILRHTFSLQVEGFSFQAPEKDFTALSTVADITTMHLEALHRNDLMRFPSIYFENYLTGQWYQFTMTNLGLPSLFPADQPPNPVTLYNGIHTLVFNQGIIVEEKTKTGSLQWLVTYNQRGMNKPDNEKLTVQSYPTTLVSNPPLIVPKTTKLLIGNGTNFFDEITFHAPTLKILHRERLLLDNNTDPTKRSY